MGLGHSPGSAFGAGEKRDQVHVLLSLLLKSSLHIKLSLVEKLVITKCAQSVYSSCTKQVTLLDASEFMMVL